MIKYLLIPLGIAVIMYAIVHIQLLLLHKVADIGLTHAKRTKINIITFISTFFAVVILVIISDYLNVSTG